MKRFSNILFVASNDASDAAPFRQALKLAKNNQAKLTIVHVIEVSRVERITASGSSGRLMEEVCRQKRQQLEVMVQDCSPDEIDPEIKVLVGKAFIEIIREVLQNGRDLVIKAVESDDSIGQQLFGGTDMKLLRKCPCPVWLVKSTQQEGYRQILVGLDYEPDNPQNDVLNIQLLEMGTSLALAEFSELHVVHAWTLEHESLFRSARVGGTEAEVDEMVTEEENIRGKWLADLVNRCCDKYGKEATEYLRPQLHLIKGDPRAIVPECAKKLGAELAVVGTVGRTGVPGLLIGNTAEAILNQIDTSVLAIKPEGFVTPVQ